MEFLYEYGLFLAKAVTVIVTFGAIVAISVAAGMKNQTKEKGHVEVSKLNDKYNNLKDEIQSVVLEEDELKTLAKAKKKEEKEEKKKLKQEQKNKSDDAEDATNKKRVFVTEFIGDIKASDTTSLREVVSSILSIATPNDEVVVKLESQGGMVHSYGLASSQLARITAKDIPLTVCVDKVAASGGYMMACVATKILAAPFAIIGSIGVVAQLPNFHKLLKKNEIDYEMLTAGEYKRTLTMFGENTDKGRQKFIEDLEDTHVLFKDFITENRPVVEIEKVATGEIWFGRRAIDQSLIDEIKTSDEYLFELNDTHSIYEVKYELKKSVAEKLGISVKAAFDQSFTNLLQALNNKIFS